MPIIDKTKEEAGRGYQILGVGRPQKKGLSLIKARLKEAIKNALPAVLIIVVIISVIVFKIHRSSFEVRCLSKYKKANTETAIKLGQLYGYSLLESYPYILDGKECELLGLSIGQAKNKTTNRISNADFFLFSENEKEEIYEKKLILNSEPSLSRDFSILTNTNFPKDGSDPIFSQLSDIKLIKIERKENIVEMDFIYSKDHITPVLIPGKGSISFHITAEYVDNKYWAISDYDYNYNINDYLLWLLGALK